MKIITYAEFSAQPFEREKLVFLLGAGISSERESYMPDWINLVRHVITEIAGSGKDTAVDAVMKRNHFLLNEVLFKIISDQIGIKETAHLLKNCFTTFSYSNLHYNIAYLAKKYHIPIITPNYDELIDIAYEKLVGSQDGLTILHVHGKVTQMEKARFSIRSVFQPLPKEYQNEIKQILQGNKLIVLGYRGADNFDLIPAIENSLESITEIYWFTSSPDKIDAEIKKFKDKLTIIITTNHDNVDQFIKMLVGKTEPCYLQKDINTSNNWWEEKIHAFFEKTPKRQELPLLWAKILEHVKISKLENSQESYPVVQAYDEYIKSQEHMIQTPPNIYNLLYAKAHRIYAKRIIGDEVIDLYPDLIWELESACITHKTKELNKLLSWTYHQYAVILQNKGHHYIAKIILDEAIALRCKMNDADCAHSLFQQFMNADKLAQSNKESMNEFAPAGWRFWLINELKWYAQRFNDVNDDAYDPEKYATTRHNLGYIYHYLSQHELTLELKNERLNEAISEYQMGKNMRMYLRDERLIAQSNVRLAECYLLKIEYKEELGNITVDPENSNIIQELTTIKKLIEETKEIYKNIPQEENRNNDLIHITQRYNKYI